MSTKVFPADKLPAPMATAASNIGDTFMETLTASTITTETDGGYKQTRPRNTRVKTTWAYSWANLSDTQYGVLKDFYKSVGTADMFTFTDYALGQSHTVRFSGDFSGQYYQPTGWSVTLTFEEV